MSDDSGNHEIDKNKQLGDSPQVHVDRLTAILPKWLVIVFASVSFFVALLLFVVAILWPGFSYTPFGRFAFCLGFAVYLAVFFFVLYPINISISKIPFIDLTVRLAGPVALVIILFLCFDKFAPHPNTSRLFEVRFEETPAKRAGMMWLVAEDHPELKYIMISESKPAILDSIYIDFPTGVTELDCEIHFGDPETRDSRFMDKATFAMGFGRGTVTIDHDDTN